MLKTGTLPLLLGIGLVVTELFATGPTTPPFTQCPAVGADTSCAILIVVTNAGISVASDSSQGPFDQIEDTLIGVQNNSSQTLFSLPLGAAVPIFSFDGDGLCTFINCTWPHPTGYEGPGVTFTGVNGSRTSGIVNFANGIPAGGSAYFSLEESIQTLCNPLTVQPALKQYSTPWGPNTYDNAPSWASTGQKTTIARWGCALTSAVMLINYHAGQQGNSFRTDPQALNDWLEAHSTTYMTSGAVWGGDVANYAKKQGGVSLSYDGSVGKDDFVLDNYLCTNNPVILQVPITKGTHFVLATGQTVAGGTSTFAINDPGFNNSTLQGYAFNYLGVRKYSTSLTPPNALVITGHSPIELIATDPSGNRTGLDPVTGQRLNQIPSSNYSTESIQDDIDVSSGASSPPLKLLEILTPSSGSYRVQVIGTGVGPYSLDFQFYDINGNPSVKTVTGGAVTGVVDSYVFSFDSSSNALPPISIPCPADLNGDGVVNVEDIRVVLDSFGATKGGPTYNPIADVNQDGIVNAVDLAFVARSHGCMTQIK
jgi:hypothetical protein